jgi:YesN/AraC family two-component response regulator
MDADDYLVKPIEPESLLPRLAKLLDTTTSRVKVLIVDDHALIREGINALLSPRPDMRVVGFAENGKEAVTKVAELDPDVVLMDIRMPEMSGLEATKVICGSPTTPRLSSSPNMTTRTT